VQIQKTGFCWWSMHWEGWISSNLIQYKYWWCYMNDINCFYLPTHHHVRYLKICTLPELVQVMALHCLFSEISSYKWHEIKFYNKIKKYVISQRWSYICQNVLCYNVTWYICWRMEKIREAAQEITYEWHIKLFLHRWQFVSLPVTSPCHSDVTEIENKTFLGWLLMLESFLYA
jgi:hypothetical protein